MSLTLVLASEDRALAQLSRQVSRTLGLTLQESVTLESALELIERQADLLLLDVRLLPQELREVLSQIRQRNPRLATVLVAPADRQGAVAAALEHGAYDHLELPVRPDELRSRLQRTIEHLELAEENRVLREQAGSRPGFAGLVGTSPKMQRLYRLLLKVSQTRSPVLLLGESGTGKELAARALHRLGPRRDQPFVPVDCAGLVPTLIESELFGYVQGAFTGATRAKKGLMETANGGTLFLDEIAELPADLQAKLLRALQEKEIKPVGGTARVALDVRVVAATNRELEAAIRDGRFRQDLYYRLNVVTLKIPPLRERKSDLPLLINYFLERLSDPARPVKAVSEDAMTRLLAYDWPGNVRELENTLERAIALGSGSVLHPIDLPTTLQNPGASAPAAPAPALAPEGIVPLHELERRAILEAVKELGGDKLAAARRLGIGKTTLYRKLKEYGVA